MQKKLQRYSGDRMIIKKIIKPLLIIIPVIYLLSLLSCSYAPPKDEIAKASAEIGLYEEWLMGLIALRNTPLKLYNPTGTLKPIESKLHYIISKLHYSAMHLSFWRNTYYAPEVILFSSRKKSAFTLPGGFICVTTGLVMSVFKKAKHPDDVLAAILAHELIHLYLEHPKRHFVTMLLKDNVSANYKKMVRGIQAAAGDFTHDYEQQIIKTILKAKEAGTEGYQAEMEFTADVDGIAVLNQANYRLEGLIEAFDLVKQHMGGVHGTYEERVGRVKEAIKNIRQKNISLKKK